LPVEVRGGGSSGELRPEHGAAGAERERLHLLPVGVRGRVPVEGGTERDRVGRRRGRGAAPMSFFGGDEAGRRFAPDWRRAGTPRTRWRANTWRSCRLRDWFPRGVRR